MRIAYIVSLFPKLSETFILREILGLKRRGHHVTIVSLKRGREMVVHDEALDLIAGTIYPDYGARTIAAVSRAVLGSPAAVVSIAGRIAAAHAGHPAILAKSVALIPEALRIARRLERERVEHIHAHWATYPALAAWVVSRLSGVPYSVTGHAHDLFLPNPMLPVKIRDSLFFATISEFNRALLIQRCGPEALRKVRLIRCGLPLADFPMGGPPAAPRKPWEIVSVGRLVDYKGFDVLIRACARLKKRGLDTRCHIVGDGPDRAGLERLVGSLAMGGSVTLAGEKPQGEVRRRIEGADLFVLAAVPGRDGQQDGIPIVLMEAMALGVPVVSTRLSGIPELVIDNRTGLLAAPGDDDHLARVIERTLTDGDSTERRRLAARSLIEREYDIERSVDALCAEFGRAGSRTAGGRG